MFKQLLYDQLEDLAELVDLDVSVGVNEPDCGCVNGHPEILSVHTIFTGKIKLHDDVHP